MITRFQHMRAAEWLDEPMVLGELVQTVADQSRSAPENLPSRWVEAIGRLTTRLAGDAAEYLGDNGDDKPTSAGLHRHYPRDARPAYAHPSVEHGRPWCALADVAGAVGYAQQDRQAVAESWRSAIRTWP